MMSKITGWQLLPTICPTLPSSSYSRVIEVFSVAVFTVVVVSVGVFFSGNLASTLAPSSLARPQSGSFQGCTSPEPKNMNTIAGTMYMMDPRRNTLFQFSNVFCERYI